MGVAVCGCFFGWGSLNRDESFVKNPMFEKVKKRQTQILTKLLFVSCVFVSIKKH
jgi:hypothetical protein